MNERRHFVHPSFREDLPTYESIFTALQFTNIVKKSFKLRDIEFRILIFLASHEKGIDYNSLIVRFSDVSEKYLNIRLKNLIEKDFLTIMKEPYQDLSRYTLNPRFCLTLLNITKEYIHLY